MPRKLRCNLDTYELPPHPDYADGYVLVRRAQLLETPCKSYGPGKTFLSEFDVQRKLSEDYARKQLGGRVYSKGVKPRVVVDKYGRENLCVGLRKKSNPEARLHYKQI